jgi:deoxyguanosine kinase
MDRGWYLVIEGAIGVGKTTLARMLREHFNTSLILEVFEENPFLAKFYESRARYAFQTQMFFLLSRYRQQQQNVVPRLRKDALISDYMFAKDRLFARLNLAGDEWDVYQQIHTALTEQIPAPDLIVYLQADIDVLIARVAQRDRPYERDMDRGYLDAVREAYEEYFASRPEASVLCVDTNPLNFVTNPADFQFIVERIRSVLREGTFQQPLPQFETPLRGGELPTRGQSLADLQRFHVDLDRAKGFSANVYLNYLHLSEEIGELGRELALLWSEEEALVAQGEPAAQARQAALSRRGQALEAELADCTAYLLRLANYTGVDLETAYLAKMHQEQDRVGPHLERTTHPQQDSNLRPTA